MILLNVLLLLFGFGSARAEVVVRAQTDNYLGSVFFVRAASSPTDSGYKILVNLSCFGTNLVNVANPISPMATVRMGIGIGPNASTAVAENKNRSGDFAVHFPGWMVMDRNSGNTVTSRTDQLNLNFPGDELKGGTAYGIQNTITIIPPAGASPQISFNNNQTISTDRTQAMLAVHYIHFSQYVPGQGRCWGNRVSQNSAPGEMLNLFAKLFNGVSRAGSTMFEGDVINPIDPKDKGWGQPECDDPTWGMPSAPQRAYYQMFQGVTGKLSGTWKSSWSSDYKLLVVDASFPGQNGFCGGYYSPLMLFFDNQRPKFTGRSHFRLDPRVSVIHWPEPNHPGYFLVYDKNGDDFINDGDELFGSTEKFDNGFDLLASYDLNHDGVIDRQDPIFSRLRLWKDSTGQGSSMMGDIYPLSALGVTQIDLRYHQGDVTIIGKRAELREHSRFNFVKGGRARTGQIIDVWLASPP